MLETVTISGLGTYLPSRVLRNDDLKELFDTSDQWISQRTGIRERRIAEPGMASSDLGVPAARAALADAGLGAEEVDMIVTATISPDQLMPATASRIAHELGAVNSGAMDLSAGCTGFVYALATATGMVSAGICGNVLVVGAETISRILDWEDRSTAVLFGDGAGAAVVSPASGSGLPADHETVSKRQHYLKMNGREVFRFATRAIHDSAVRVLDKCGRSASDVDLFIPHQANMRIIEVAAKKVGIPEGKMYTNLQRYGNTSCASIPLCLAEAGEEGRLREGDLILLAGFGAGLTWGCCLLEWGGS